MTRDEALELIIHAKPCFYTGDILKHFLNRELYVIQLSPPTSPLQAAQVGMFAKPGEQQYDSVWVKFTELSVEECPSDK